MDVDASVSQNSTIETLFIEDEEYDSKEKFKQIATDIQDLWNRYLTISKNMIETDEAFKGDRANNYLAFINTADEVMGNQFSEVITQLSTNMDTYISQIDAADEVLYD